jgi:DNA polymerase III subunit gamma/tau
MDTQAPQAIDDSGYTVVARRYRPKSFQELIGQSHISQALEKAIASGRVGHAYLFTGARGVGKTSTARIFAKALNLPRRSSQTDSNRLAEKDDGADSLLPAEEIARAIDAGEDIDVIEIDGASNRGIEEIRQLRANVNVRPSRSPYKIYIIDEVHMLTNQAFNALLKTLEEPPQHVKFIFCTTDPDKIPITVLSRCQRFDFAPVKLEAIQSRLKEIAEKEGYQADEEALALLARRAAGSMRDSQSLLEQVMSFSTERITVDQVHALLGTADESRLVELVEALIAANPLQAIQLVDTSIRGGADAGQVAEQLLGYLRDVLAAGIGGGSELLKIASPTSIPKLAALAETWGIQTLLAAIQILDESLVRMRSSVAAVALLEVALVQICQLEQLASIPALLDRIAQAGSGRSGGNPAAAPQAQKKNDEPLNQPPNTDAVQPAAGPEEGESQSAIPVSRSASSTSGRPDTPTPAGNGHTESPSASEPESGSLARENKGFEDGATANALDNGSSDALSQWKRAIAPMDGLLADYASVAVAVEPIGSKQWKIIFPAGASQPKEYCEQSEKRAELQQCLRVALGRDIALQFAVLDGPAAPAAKPVSNSALRAQKLREMSNHPYVKRLCEVLDGEIIRVDPGRENSQPPESLLQRSAGGGPQAVAREGAADAGGAG